MTKRNNHLDKIIREVRKECDIEGQSAVDWKKLAEAIALKYAPALQPKKPLGRPPVPDEIKGILELIEFAQVGYYRNKFNLTVRDAVDRSPISWGNFQCKSRGSFGCK